jgi:hypothetical protein
MTLNRIIKFINDKYKINITSKNSSGSNTYLKYYYYALARKYTKHSLKDIGAKVHREHSTLVHGLKTHDNRLDVEPKYSREFKELEKEFIQQTDKENVIQIATAHKIIKELKTDLSDIMIEGVAVHLSKIIKNTIH